MEEQSKGCSFCLTGIWEKKLRDIEKRQYDAAQFVDELKKQITDIVNDVLADTEVKHVDVGSDEKETKKKRTTKNTNKKTSADDIVGKPCPLCATGTIIKGKAAYGCSRWKEGCTYRVSFADHDK